MRFEMFFDDTLGGESFVAQLAIVAFAWLLASICRRRCRRRVFPSRTVLARALQVMRRRRRSGRGVMIVGLMLMVVVRCLQRRVGGRLAAVGAHVRVQVGQLSERFVARAYVTLVGPFARVTSPMLPQMRELRKSFLAELATIRFLAAMDAHVLIEVHFLLESFKALIAFVWLVAARLVVFIALVVRVVAGHQRIIRLGYRRYALMILLLLLLLRIRRVIKIGSMIRIQLNRLILLLLLLLLMMLLLMTVR